MGVLVGVRELGERVEALVGDDHHPLVLVVVEAEHLVAEQLELELRDVLVGPSSPSARRDALSSATSSGG